MDNVVSIAQDFAQALDGEDYESARQLLCRTCRYSCRGQSYVGPDEIVASYKANGANAQSRFNSVTYESSVSGLPDGKALIRFVDHLSRNGKRFTFQCEQVIAVGGSGQITRIDHRDLPGQREALAEFMKDFA